MHLKKINSKVPCLHSLTTLFHLEMNTNTFLIIYNDIIKLSHFHDIYIIYLDMIQNRQES